MYVVSITARDYSAAPPANGWKEMFLPGGRDVDVKVVLSAAVATLYGKVTSSGKAAAGARRRRRSKRGERDRPGSGAVRDAVTHRISASIPTAKSWDLLAVHPRKRYGVPHSEPHKSGHHSAAP